MEVHAAHRLNRQQFPKIVAGGAIGAALSRMAYAQPPSPTSHVYKTVGECQIKADVYQAALGARKPAVILLHTHIADSTPVSG